MKENVEMDEKRIEQRHSVNHEFESLGDFVREYVLNVSRGGAFIRSAEVLPIGTSVRVKFTIVDGAILTIEGEGRVARAVLPTESDEPGMGVVFTSLTEASRQALEQIVTLREP